MENNGKFVNNNDIELSFKVPLKKDVEESTVPTNKTN